MNRRGFLIAMCLIALSGCSTLRGRKGDGVKAPDHIEPHVEDLMNAAIAGFRDTHGLDLKWDRSWDLRIVEVPIIRYQGGYPVIAFEDGGAGAYYEAIRKTIYVPNKDLRRDTLVHEFGHFLLHKNEFGLMDHHERFPKFFNRYTYGGGRAL